MEDPVFFRHIAVVGLGMIGASYVKALRKSGFQGMLSGVDTQPENLTTATQSGLLDLVTDRIEEAVQKADLVIVSVPLGAMERVFEALAPAVPSGCLVTDAGSVKGTVMASAQKILSPNGIRFIGGHPMAGSEKTGFEAGSPILFENAYYFLTPIPEEDPLWVERMKAFIRQLGGLPVQIEMGEHDRMASAISHLPHLTAAMLVNSFCKQLPEETLKFSGGGFRDSTRIASGSATLWRDIFLHNKEALIHSLDVFLDEMMQFRSLLVEENPLEIVYNLNKARWVRTALPKIRMHDDSRFHRLVLDAEDRPGIIAEVANLLAEHSLSIKDITIDHARDQTPGAITISFATLYERDRAVFLIEQAGICPAIPEQDGTEDDGNQVGTAHVQNHP